MNDFVATINNRKITITFISGNKISINNEEYIYDLSVFSGSTYKLTLDNKPYLITSKKNGSSEYLLSIKGELIETKVLTFLQEKDSNLIASSAAKHSVLSVKSPMPGMILKIKKNPGDEVAQGNSIIILEAMKMENDIRSPASGKINELFVKEGDKVEKGVVLFTVK